MGSINDYVLPDPSDVEFFQRRREKIHLCVQQIPARLPYPFTADGTHEARQWNHQNLFGA